MFGNDSATLDSTDRRMNGRSLRIGIVQARFNEDVTNALAQACRAELLALGGVTKAGFGLGEDRRHIVRKLGVEPVGLLELNQLFRERGYRKDMGVKGAVAVLFQQRFIKSKKASTSNWAQPRLSEAQLVYAANDAYAAIRVLHALEADPT
jgi:hypothetical protein